MGDETYLLSLPRPLSIDSTALRGDKIYLSSLRLLRFDSTALRGDGVYVLSFPFVF